MRNPPALSPSLTGFSNGWHAPADAVKTFFYDFVNFVRLSIFGFDLLLFT
ncbi:MAG: hypothetical protein M3209_13465 [Acidobacteriota bacterium]|nr:hypothetical protein [Acidobacteriota bacterium]